MRYIAMQRHAIWFYVLHSIEICFTNECVITNICYLFCPARITPVFEHKNSIVTLHCEIEKPTDPSIEVRVIWLYSDTIIEPSEYVDIIKPVSFHF